MSETDSFIQEVTEEVRQDRMYRRWKKYGPYVITAVVAIVAASAGWTWYKNYKVQAAREAGGAFLAASIDSAAEQQDLIETVDGPAEIVARLRLAAAMAAEGDGNGAAEIYRSVAADPSVGEAYSDLARLQAVRVTLATMEPAQAIAELEPLTAADAPYRLLALELRAVARLNSGDTEGAHADLLAILTDPASTRGLQERAGVMLASSGGRLPETPR